LVKKIIGYDSALGSTFFKWRKNVAKKATHGADTAHDSEVAPRRAWLLRPRAPRICQQPLVSHRRERRIYIGENIFSPRKLAGNFFGCADFFYDGSALRGGK